MHSFLRPFAGAAFMLATVGSISASAQTTPIKRMDCTNDWPRCGFGESPYGEGEGTFFTRTRVAGGAPSGRDSVLFRFLPTSQDRQFDYGWYFQDELDAPDGTTRYIRYRVKVRSPVNWASNNSNGVGGKMIILGNTCEDAGSGGGQLAPGYYAPTRVISNFVAPPGATSTSGFHWHTSQNIAGDPIRFDAGNGMVAADRWSHVQIKIVSSSRDSSPTGSPGVRPSRPAQASEISQDGRLYIYIDAANASENTPSGASPSGFRLRTRGWSDRDGCNESTIVFGGTTGTSAAQGSNVQFELADFEYDDQFDPNWHLGSGPTLPFPSAPTNVRVIRLAALFALPGVLAGVFVRRRHRD